VFNVALLNPGQSAPIGRNLPLNIGVIVTSGGSPVAGVAVSAVAPPGSATEPSFAFTDAIGRASFLGFVGKQPGALTFQFLVTGLDGLPLGTLNLAATAADVPSGRILTVVNKAAAVIDRRRRRRTLVNLRP
jgi:hypothetical protein